MNNKEKKEKKQYISQSINLDNGRFKDSEINLLVDLVKNWNKFNGLSKKKQKSMIVGVLMENTQETRKQHTHFNMIYMVYS